VSALPGPVPTAARLTLYCISNLPGTGHAADRPGSRMACPSSHPPGLRPIPQAVPLAAEHEPCGCAYQVATEGGSKPGTASARN